MKLARRALDDPERMNELKRQLDAQLAEMLAEATAARYATREGTDFVALQFVKAARHRAKREGSAARSVRHRTGTGRKLQSYSVHGRPFT